MALSRAQKKFITIERARRRLQNRLNDIDWELDVLSQQTKELGELEAEGKKVDIELEAGDDEEQS